jgi:Amt family ammonium transporter
VADGLLFGNPGQLFVQAVAVGVAILYSALGTFLLLKLVGLFTPLRATPKEEGAGLDVAQHGEEAYASGEGAILVLSEGLPPAPKPAGGKA